MAAIDFPNSPANNDTFNSAGRTWLYNGTAWTLLTLTQTVIPSNSVTSSSIVNDSIVNADINSSAAIAYSKLNLGTSIAASDLAANAVTTAKILDANVTAEKLAADAVTQAKIADRAVGSAELDNLTLNSQTGTSYTLVLADAHKLVTLSNASAITLTIPTNSSVAFEIGDQVNIAQLGAGQVTVGGAGVTLRSQGSKLKLNGQYSAATLIKIDTNEWVLVGNTAA